MRVHSDPRPGVIGFEIRWRPPRFHKYDTRIEKYNIIWKAVHTKLTKNAEQEERKTATSYEVFTDTQGQLTKGETYEVTVVSVSYDTYSVVNGSNQKDYTISKLIIWITISKFPLWIFQCKTSMQYTWSTFFHKDIRFLLGQCN